MKWLTARSGNEIYAFEKEKLVTMVLDPKISEIPESNSDVRGVSFYQDKAVVFYQTGSKRKGRIGVLMTNELDALNGMLVEEVLDEVEELQETAKEFVSGMWVITCD